MDDAHADLPADRGQLSTERRLPASGDLDVMSTADVLAVIHEADASVVDVVHAAMVQAAPLVDRIVDAMNRGGRLIYIGAGTSGRLGVLDASECPPTFFCDPGDVVGLIAGGDGALRRSVEGAEDDPQGASTAFGEISVGDRDVVVGIAASGATPYVLGGLNLARALGATTAMMHCALSDELLIHLGRHSPALCDAIEQADHVIAMPVGAEVVTGSTRMKSGLATKMMLHSITTAVMVKRGKTWGNLMVDVRATNAKLRDRALRMITEQSGISRDDADRRLNEAGGRVKIALVMARHQITAEAAATMLEAASGRLRDILGPPR